MLASSGSHQIQRRTDEIGPDIGFPNQALERKLADQKLRALLVLADLTERDGFGTVAMGLLHSAGRRSCLGGELHPRCLAAGGFASSLLRTSHFESEKFGDENRDLMDWGRCI